MFDSIDQDNIVLNIRAGYSRSREEGLVAAYVPAPLRTFSKRSRSGRRATASFFLKLLTERGINFRHSLF